MRMARRALAATAAACLVVTGGQLSGQQAASAPVGTASTAAAAAPLARVAPEERVPRLRVRAIKGGLDVPWDLTFLPGGGMLYTQRSRLALRYRGPGGSDRAVSFRRGPMWAAGETGLMSILATRQFARTRQFLTCHGATTARGHDVRVVLWRLKQNARRAVHVRQVLKGLPATSGRHGGCRLRYGPEGALYVGTGDAALSGAAQSLRSGGGKVLRIRPLTGRPWPGNPFLGRDRPITRKIFTYGHRNVQGLARRPGAEMWSVEHGSYRDDEVNRLRRGGNYGWNPGPGYDETGPMTDHSLPGRQISARWRSGTPTIATSGAVWLRGRQWGTWNGALAVAALKDTSLRIMKFDGQGRFVRMWTPPALNRGDRLRSPVLGPDGNLYVTTANGGGGDRILKVVPR